MFQLSVSALIIFSFYVFSGRFYCYYYDPRCMISFVFIIFYHYTRWGSGNGDFRMYLYRRIALFAALPCIISIYPLYLRHTHIYIYICSEYDASPKPVKQVFQYKIFVSAFICYIFCIEFYSNVFKASLRRFVLNR